MIIRPFQTSDLLQISEIVASLHPKWFDNNAVVNIPIDAQLGRSFVAQDNKKIKGFIILSSLEGKVWINWIGVDLSFQGQLFGTNLLKHAENILKDLGVKELRVDTVIEQLPADGSYDKTIRFYLKNGFKVVKKYKQRTFNEFVYRRGVMLKKLH
ncbi:GNAT family N-acetyltransferase [Candidatus Woesebacteria bacterium]|nr:MAG: GNAT family N-acetyltransferase [Candidatus Woesebacteria bacterium]